MVSCQRLLIACLLFRIIFPGDFAPLGVRTLYDTHGRQKSKDSRIFLIDFVPALLHVTSVPSLSCTRNINLLNPTCHVIHHQFNIQQLYALPTLYLFVLYLSENKQRLMPLTA
jgi:hypothetical protein